MSVVLPGINGKIFEQTDKYSYRLEKTCKYRIVFQTHDEMMEVLELAGNSDE